MGSREDWFPCGSLHRKDRENQTGADISRKAVSAGFEWETLDDVWVKVHEEIDELNILNEVALTTVIDGKPGLGWCEMYWDSRYLAHMKQFPALRR